MIERTSVKFFWFIPIILSIHNLEEALTMPQWMSVHLPILRSTFPFFEHLQFSTPQLYGSLFFVTLIPFLITFFCLRGRCTPKKLSLLLILQAIIFWNALMPHISGLFLLGMYNPGIITAVLCNIPFSVYLYKKVLHEGIMSVRVLWYCIFIGLVAYLPVVYANHLLSQFIVTVFFVS